MCVYSQFPQVADYEHHPSFDTDFLQWEYENIQMKWLFYNGIIILLL